MNRLHLKSLYYFSKLYLSNMLCQNCKTTKWQDKGYNIDLYTDYYVIARGKDLFL